MSKLIKLVLLTLGCVFLVWALNNVELSSVFDLLKKLGWGFIIILIIYSGVTWLDAFSWKYNFRPDETLSFSNWDLWRIRQIGEAYNIIIPFATLGGEPIKAHLLKNNHGLAMKQAIASQIVAKNTFLTGLILFFIPGIYMILLSPQISEEFKFLSLLGMGVFSTLILLFFIFQVTGALGRISVWIKQRNQNPKLTPILIQIEHLSELFSGFYKKYPGRIIKAIGLAFLGWVLGLAEMYATLYFVGFNFSLYEIWVIESLAQLIKIGSFMIPLSLGAQEGGLMLIFSAFGYPSSLGLTVSLVRRLKELTWVTIGLALGARMSFR